ncbi:MAG: S8 family serine peptidase [Acidimicrobiia bacterium]
MRAWKPGRLILAVVMALTAVPLAASAASKQIDPSVVRAQPMGTCFDGLTVASDCSPVIPFADDWVLAGAAQDAQIAAAGGISTNASCSGYYVTMTIVSRYSLAKFNTTFNPPSDGVILRASSIAVPSGFSALDMTSTTYDAYSYIAHLYATNDPQVAGIAAPLYVLTAAPVPRAGPGTMPVPASPGEAWAPSERIAGTATVVVFDTSVDPRKMDLAPRDGFLDATAGHATFIEGILEAVYEGPVELVDITDSRGIITEASMAVALATYPFVKGDVASLSAGTYACQVGDRTIHPLLLADAVERLDAQAVPLAAAAGNDATTMPFYPAAWGVHPTPKYVRQCPPGTLYREAVTRLCMIDRADVVTSVGSIASSTPLVSYTVPSAAQRSAFSNHGNWVEAWAVGENLVSTYPGGAYSYCVPAGPGMCAAPGGGTVGVPAQDAPAAHIGAHARWDGTSFATPMVAAWIAGGKVP